MKLLDRILDGIERRHRERQAVLERIVVALERFSMDAPTVLALLDAANIPAYFDDDQAGIAERIKYLIDRNHALQGFKKHTGGK